MDDGEGVRGGLEGTGAFFEAVDLGAVAREGVGEVGEVCLEGDGGLEDVGAKFFGFLLDAETFFGLGF